MQHIAIKSYKWEDHHSPPLITLFEICQDMYEYLLDPGHVAVIHCNAGKGRTGTCIAGFLIYSGFAKTSQDAIRYYGRKRFKTGLGITQPSQIRYVRYFELVYKEKILSPGLRILKKVKMHRVPHMNGKSCKPYLEIVTVQDGQTIYSGKICDYLKTYKEVTDRSKPISKTRKNSRSRSALYAEQSDYRLEENKINNKYHMNNQDNLLAPYNIGQVRAQADENSKEDSLKNDELLYVDNNGEIHNEIILPQRTNIELVDDGLFKIYHKSFSNPLVCRFCVNTSFIFKNETHLSIKDLDPGSIRKDNKICKDFEIILVTEAYGKRCDSQTPINELCKAGKRNLSDEIKIWNRAQQIISDHKRIYASKLDHKKAIEIQFIHSNKNDYETILGNKDDFMLQSFRWTKKGGDGAFLNEDCEEDQDSEDSSYYGSEFNDEFKMTDQEEDENYLSTPEFNHKAFSTPQLNNKAYEEDSDDFFKMNREIAVTRESTHKDMNDINSIFAPSDIEFYFDDKKEQKKSLDEENLFDGIQEQHVTQRNRIPRNGIVKTKKTMNLAMSNQIQSEIKQRTITLEDEDVSDLFANDDMMNLNT